MRALLIVSWVAFLLYIAACESLLDALGPVWFLGVGLAILGAMLVSSKS